MTLGDVTWWEIALGVATGIFVGQCGLDLRGALQRWLYLLRLKKLTDKAAQESITVPHAADAERTRYSRM